MGAIKRKRAPSGLLYIPDEESARADADGHRLYSMAKRLEITPVQAIVRYFIRGKGQCQIQSDFDGLLKILSLLPDCDWYQDPAIWTDEETKRRAVIRERGKPWMTTEILSQEDVTEQYLKPLLGETFDVAEFLRRLVEGSLAPEDAKRELKSAYARRPERSEGYAKAALNLDGTFAEPGDNQHTLKEGGLHIVQTTEHGHGNSAAYLAARLKKAGRDDLLEQIGPGKTYPSIRQAAIEAGIVKPVPVVRITTPEVIATKLRQYLTPDQITALVEALLA